METAISGKRRIISLVLALALFLGTVLYQPDFTYGAQGRGVGASGGGLGLSPTVVTGFAPLAEAVAVQYYTAGQIVSVAELALPEGLEAKSQSGEPLAIEGVLWNYIPENTLEAPAVFDPAVPGSYTFAAALPGQYRLAEGVEAPVINIVVVMGIQMYSNGTYHAGDVAVLKSLIMECGLAEDADAPESWRFVTWSGGSNDKRVTGLNLSNRGLTGSLKITGLSELKNLNCTNNQLETLEVINLNNLEALSCYSNALIELKMENLPKLKDLRCDRNALSELDVSGLTELSYLLCSNNQLEELDLSGLSNLGDNSSIVFNPIRKLVYPDGRILTAQGVGNGAIEMTLHFGGFGEGSRVTYTIPSAPAEYRQNFVRWESEEVTVTNSSKTSLTFITTDRNMAVRAVFGYGVTVRNPPEGGSVRVVASPVEQGSTVTLITNPFNGWELESWVTEPNGLNVTGSGNTYTFTMPGEPVEITPVFRKIDYGVTLTQAEGGEVRSSHTTAQVGDVVTLHVETEPGWYLNRWSTGMSGIAISSTGREGEYSFTMASREVQITPVYAKERYTVKVTDGDGGYTYGAQSSYSYGDTAFLTAEPDLGYSFDGWYENNNRIEGAGASYEFTVTGNRVLETKFSIIDYTIDVTASEGGSVTGGGVYHIWDIVTLVATPNPGYKFVGWFENGEKVLESSSSPVYWFYVLGNQTLEARFEPIQYRITLVPQAGGTVSGGGDHAYGSTPAVTAIPSEGYTFDGWYENNNMVTQEESYRFTVTGARTLEARFSKKNYGITATAGQGGSAAGGGTYSHNTRVTLTATPSTGFVFEGWYENGYKIDGAGAVYRFTATEARELEARFSRITYTVTITAGQGGSVSGGGGYAYESVVTLRAMPAEGYYFDGWYENNERINGVGVTYTFAAIADRTLEARFARNIYNITATAGQGGTAWGGGSFEHGDTVSLTALPDGNHTFEGWYENGVRLNEATAAYTFAANGDRVLEARFTPVPAYAVTITKEGIGSAAASPSPARAGQQVALSAIAGDGYRFVRWQVVGGSLTDLSDSADPDATFTMPGEAVELRAIFEQAAYPLTVVNGTGSGRYRPGESVAIAADDPPEGQVFYRWEGGESGMFGDTAKAATTFTMPGNAVTVTATYKNKDGVDPGPAVYRLTVNGGSGSGLYEAGRQVIIQAGAPPAGMVFDRWQASAGSFADAMNPTTLYAMPGSDATVTAIYISKDSSGDGSLRKKRTKGRAGRSIQDADAPITRLEGLPETVRVGDEIILMPSRNSRVGAAGWSWDEAYFTADFDSAAVFTARKAGITSITFTTAGGLSTTLVITVQEADGAGPS